MAEHRYTVFFEPQAEGGYRVVFPAIPQIVTWGTTLDEAREMAADALRCHLDGLAKEGGVLPGGTRPVGTPWYEEPVKDSQGLPVWKGTVQGTLTREEIYEDE